MTPEEYARAERRLDLGVRLYGWAVAIFAIFAVTLIISLVVG